jgi:hypothetical protein
MDAFLQRVVEQRQAEQRAQEMRRFGLRGRPGRRPKAEEAKEKLGPELPSDLRPLVGRRLTEQEKAARLVRGRGLGYLLGDE